MIISENEFSYSKLKKLIGNPIKLENTKPIGSCGFYLKSIESINEENDQVIINSKCNIQAFSDGILLRFNHSNSVLSLPINNNSLKQIEFVRGKEIISLRKFSLMSFLLKCGMKIRYARYFANNRNGNEYKIEEVELKIETSNNKMKFITNGYYFESQISFFETINKTKKVTIRKKPTHNTGYNYFGV